MGGGEGRSFNDDMYAPYEGPDGATRSASGGGGGGGSGFGGAASSGAPVYGGAAREYPTGDPSQQIMVRNVSPALLIWPSLHLSDIATAAVVYCE